MVPVRVHAKFLLLLLGILVVLFSIFAMIQTGPEARLLWLFSGMLIVMGCAVYAAVRWLVLLPLRSLHQGAEIIRKGNLGYQIPVEGRDEFADLAGSFNEMTSRLKETLEGLENTVRTRSTELNENVRLMQGILASISSGVALLTRDGNVKLMNRQGVHILRRGKEDLVGSRLTEIVPETQAFLHARAGAREEIAVQVPGGNSVPIGFTSSPYAAGGGDPEYRIVVFQDLTELKALQGELMNKEILERELKDPAQQELCHALLAETKRLNHLVEELLLYGRPMKLLREDTDLRVLWEEVLDQHREELRERGIKVTGDYAVRHPIAYFDPYQVRQVFQNLLRNAMEATPDGGSISITMLLADNFLMFRVTDNGSGIPKDNLEHVFDLFYTTKPKGTGLGLAICRKIIRDHGGDIEIESTAGIGTTVSVTLPYRSFAEAEAIGLA
ncbi:MAG: multi-sensor signal transduction histidine kinase [Nitrospirae bacterium]|nr:multi-sensor signal transduction histidine kinase [Nitrospirota bacterium]